MGVEGSTSSTTVGSVEGTIVAGELASTSGEGTVDRDGFESGPAGSANGSTEWSVGDGEGTTLSIPTGSWTGVASSAASGRMTKYITSAVTNARQAPLPPIPILQGHCLACPSDHQEFFHRNLRTLPTPPLPLGNGAQMR